MDAETPPDGTESTQEKKSCAPAKRISGPYCAKKRATIMAMLTTEILGQRMEWGRPDVCAKSTWYDKWRHDPLIRDVMDKVRETIIDARTREAAQAVDEALLIIQEQAPAAAAAIVNLLRSHDESQRRLAAESILNRASTATAEKQSTTHTYNADQLARLEKQAQDELAEWEEQYRQQQQPDDDAGSGSR